VTVQDHGNTSAASIPLALSVGVERGQIKQGDLLVTEDDLTLNEAYAIEKAAACNWVEIDPVRSANHCRAVVGVCLESRLNLSHAEVEARLGALTVSELVDAISRREVTPVPLD
jgi:hypothetical protein